MCQLPRVDRRTVPAAGDPEHGVPDFKPCRKNFFGNVFLRHIFVSFCYMFFGIFTYIYGNAKEYTCEKRKNQGGS